MKLLISLLIGFSCVAPAVAQISLTSPGTAYTQNFDTLATTGTSSTLPAGWALSETGTNANTTYNTGTGSSNAGDTYSFGASGNSERALGSVASGSLVSTIGASFTNNTGATITSLSIAFTTELWRRGTATADKLAFGYSTNATSLTTGTYTAVPALNAASVAGCTASTDTATNGNSPTCRTAVSSTISGLSIPSGATFWIRWADSNDTGNDDGIAIDDFSLTPNGTAGLSLSLSPTSLTFNALAGSVAPTQTTSLSASTGTPAYTSLSDASWLTVAPAGGSAPQTITVTADATGLGSGSLTGHVTFSSAGYTDGVLTVTFNVGAPPVITNIDQITGSGTASPKAGQAVTTRGVVTAVRSTTGTTRGFYIEAMPADRDADPLTSEGLLVFVGSASLPACAVVGNLIEIDGTVSDFVTSTAPVGSIPLTELGSPANCQVLATNSLGSLPAAVTIDASNPLVVGGSATQARKWLSMRVSMPNAVVVGASLGNLTETAAQSTFTGEFFVTLPGVPRPQHGAGIQATRRPSDAAGTVPSWNGNPEVMRVNTTALSPAGTPYAVAVGATVAGLSGVMDYNTSDGDYQLYTNSAGAGTPTPSSPNLAATPVPAALPTDLTIGSFNMERFFNDVNENNGAALLTTTAYQGRLQKASLAIRNVMRMPDIIGLEEVEGKRNSGGAIDPHVVDAIASRVNADAAAAGQGNPNYTWCIGVTNDPGAISAAVIYKQGKVQLTECAQYGVNTMYNEPDGGSNFLNDRPPVTFKGTATAPGSDSGIPVRLVVNHLRSLGGIDEPGAGNGDQVRTKRNQQAKFLGRLINGTSGEQAVNWNTADNLVVVGDFNAYHVNDGYADVMNCIAGNPPAANSQYFTAAQLAVDSPCTPILSPALTVLTAQNPASYYSYVFSGSIQTLDHVLLNSNVLPRFRQLAYARNDAEFPEGPTYRNDFTRPERVSDHDMPVLYLSLPVEVTSRTRLNATGLALNRATGRYTGLISVTNTGATPLTGPVYVFFSNLTPGVTLPDLPTFNGQPYATINLGAGLAPGATGSTISISFADPTNARIGYTTTRFDGTF
jgi:predicted extracellular nuclease